MNFLRYIFNIWASFNGLPFAPDTSRRSVQEAVSGHPAGRPANFRHWWSIRPE